MKSKITSNDLTEKIQIFEEKTGKKFIDFYNKYLQTLIFYNIKFVKDAEIAEDIAANAIYKSLDKVDKYDNDKAAFSTWLFTISRNDCIQYNNSLRTLSIDKTINEDGSSLKDFLESSTIEDSFDKDIENLNELKGDLIRKSIPTLKEKFRKVIQLREIEEMSYREITIELREEKSEQINTDYFNAENVIDLIDPEKKKEDSQLIKYYSINSIEDSEGNPVKYEVIARDKDGLISRLALPNKGTYLIKGEVPYNINTVKSQIKNGRKLLKEMLIDKFKVLDNMYI
jgi:RNA polymerase sigma factor (sigma-70 family)